MRCAIYCRLSEEDRNKRNKTDESESIQNQKSLLIEYCENNKWEIYDIYCDEDMSGADNSRPEFNRMIEDCRNGKIDIVLCKTQSRFSRDIEIVEHYIHNKFLEWKVRFIGLLDHADTEDFANKKSRQINGLVNEWYLEDLSENIKKTLRHKKEKGIYTGSFAPYGYKLSSEHKGKLFVDNEAAEIVKNIYSMYLSGLGYVKIAKTLNYMCIPCPSEYKRLSGSKYKPRGENLTSKIWTESVVREILTNRVYKGDLVQGKTQKVSYKNKKRLKTPKEDLIIFENAHDAVVEREIWEKVNNRIGGGERVSLYGKRHILSGKVYCECCGSVMWKMSYALKDGRYEYLKCKATKCTDKCKNKKSIRLDAVTELLEMEIRKLLKKYYKPEKINISKFNRQKSGGENEEKDIKNLILKQNLNIKQLYKDKLDGIIDSEMFCSIQEDIKEDIRRLQRRLLELRKRNVPEINISEYIYNFCDRINIDEFAVSCFVKRIYIGEEDGGRRKITIIWKL